MDTASFIPSSEGGDDDTDIESEDESKEESETTSSMESKMASLQDQMREAIEKEDYERAAVLRDKINKLKDSN